MAGATPTTVDAALKETWTSDNIIEQLYNQNPLLKRIRKLKTTQVGQQAVTPVHTGRNWGYTALPAAGGTLNTAGAQELKQATWNYTHHNVQIKIQGSAIDGTQNDTLSVAEVIDMEVTGALGDLERQLSRQLFMAGDALITACGTTTTSATVVLNVADGFNALERGWLGIGSVIDIGTTADEVAIGDARTITAVTESSSAPTIVISGATVSTTSSHYVSLANSRLAAVSYEMNGLDLVVDSAATLGGLTVAAAPTWASYEDSTSQALTLPLMYNANRKVMQKTGKPANYVVTGLKQQQKFYELVQAQVRFAGDAKTEAGNVDGVGFNGMTVHAMPDCKNEQMYFLTIEDLLLVSSGSPYWQNKHTGGKILAHIQGEDAYGAKITVRHQLGASRRNSHAKMTGLS
jgi:hypothetical protein